MTGVQQRDAGVYTCRAGVAGTEVDASCTVQVHCSFYALGVSINHNLCLDISLWLLRSITALCAVLSFVGRLSEVDVNLAEH